MASGASKVGAAPLRTGVATGRWDGGGVTDPFETSFETLGFDLAALFAFFTSSSGASTKS